MTDHDAVRAADIDAIRARFERQARGFGYDDFHYHAFVDVRALLADRDALAAEVERQAEDLHVALNNYDDAMAKVYAARGEVDRAKVVIEDLHVGYNARFCDTVAELAAARAQVADLEAELERLREELEDALDGGPITATPTAMEQIKALKAELAEARTKDEICICPPEPSSWLDVNCPACVVYLPNAAPVRITPPEERNPKSVI